MPDNLQLTNFTPLNSAPDAVQKLETTPDFDGPVLWAAHPQNAGCMTSAAINITTAVIVVIGLVIICLANGILSSVPSGSSGSSGLTIDFLILLAIATAINLILRGINNSLNAVGSATYGATEQSFWVIDSSGTRQYPIEAVAEIERTDYPNGTSSLSIFVRRGPVEIGQRRDDVYLGRIPDARDAEKLLRELVIARRGLSDQLTNRGPINAR